MFAGAKRPNRLASANTLFNVSRCMAVISRFLNSTRTAMLLLRKTTGSFPCSNSGRSRRTLLLTARRRRGGCVQGEHDSLELYSHSHIWIQPPQISYIPFTASPFQSCVLCPRDLISSPTRNRVFPTLSSSVTCLSDYHLLFYKVLR